MLTVLLDTLFAVAGIGAVAAIAATCRSHGRSVLTLRQQLRCSPQIQTVTFVMHSARTAQPETAELLHPEFKRPARKAHPEYALRAAA